MVHKLLSAAVDASPDPSVVDGHLAVAELPIEAIFDKSNFQTECMDVVRAANPDLVDEMSFAPTGEQQAEGQPSWVFPVMVACDQTMLLRLIGEIAGAELTNDSFRAALDELGPVDLHGYGQASYNSESKWDGLDEFYLQQYDHDAGEVTILGDAIIVER